MICSMFRIHFIVIVIFLAFTCKAFHIVSSRTCKNAMTILKSSNSEEPLESVRGMKGLYRRPSKAIEQGGGFFIPGLEDEKIRVFTGFILLALFAVNHDYSNKPTTSLLITELTGIISTIYIFLKGVFQAIPFNTVDTAAPILLSNLYVSSLTTEIPSEAELKAISLAIPGTRSIVILREDLSDKILERGPVGVKLFNIKEDKIRSQIESCLQKIQGGNSYCILTSEEMKSFNVISLNNNESIQKVMIAKDIQNRIWLIQSKDEKFDISYFNTLMDIPF